MRVLRVSSFVIFVAIATAVAIFMMRSIGTIAKTNQPQVLAASVVTTEPADMGIVSKINKVRVEAGVPAIAYSPAMKLLTTVRVTDMSTKQYYSHTSPTGIKFGDIIKDYDPTSSNSCENLQLQVGDDWQSAVDAWVSSPAHYRCLINPDLDRGAGSVVVYDDIAYEGSKGSKQMFVFAFIATN